MQFHAHLIEVPAHLDQTSRDHHVLHAEQQQGLGQQTVPPGAARLLVVALDVLRHVVVHDEPHIGLVDPHAERHRRHDHMDVVPGEGVLHSRALGRGHAGVIRGSPDARLPQALGHLLDPLAAQAVDDP